MAHITIEINRQTKTFILHGDLSGVLGIGRARLFLKDVLSYIQTSDKELLIPFTEDNLEKVFRNIRKFLVNFGLEETLSEDAQALLASYLNEEERFKEFSRHAFQIRNNELSDDHKRDFAEFASVVKLRVTNRTLYPRQILSAYHLAFSQNACNFSVPGSGKTSIVYAAYSYLCSLPEGSIKKVDKIVILGPLSSFAPWEDEYKECFGRKADSLRIHGGLLKADLDRFVYGSSTPELVLSSYHSAARVSKELLYFLSKNRCMVVLDEAHKIKNTDGGILADAALGLSKSSHSRVVLTGTPAPNGYEDLYNLFKFIWPTKNLLQYNPGHLRAMSASSRDQRVNDVIKNISPYFIRITKKDMGLPKPIENPPVQVEMGKVQRQIYNYIERKYMKVLSPGSNGTGFSDMVAKARMIRLMQAATNPTLLQKPLTEYIEAEELTGLKFAIDDTIPADSQIIQLIKEYNKLEKPQKFIVVGELVQKIIAEGGKVVVWAIFIHNIEALQEYLRSIGVASKVLYGKTPIEADDEEPEVETREQIIREFHKLDSGFKVLIANPFAVSESISLHKACHNAVYLERSFNAAHFVQSKDRIHRYGLKASDVINYYYLLSNTNIDRTIHARLKLKEDRMTEIMEKEEIPLFKILDDEQGDIKALIDNYVSTNTPT